MAEYQQYCPVARATEIFADRWTPLVLRELLAGSRRFNEIHRGLPRISRSLLASRLRHLEDCAIVERHAGTRPNLSEYALTEAGLELKKVIEQLGAWGAKWAFGQPKPEELDPALLLWKMHQRIHRDRLPAGRTVVEFEFPKLRNRRFWLVLEPREVSLCVKPPGFDSSLIVRADLAVLYRVWVGHLEYRTALREGGIVVNGPPSLARELPRWLMFSPMAPFVRAERECAPARR
jgi:DNA-binding HxlR family transcriptional regulator